MLRGALAALVPPPATKAPSRPDRFPLMESMRALAALSVFGFHVAREVDLPAKDFTNTLAAGVSVFFVISGFLLYRPFALAHLRDDPAPSARAYAWRRALRILPPFWIALTVYVLLGPHTPSSQLPALYGFAQVYDPTTVLSGLAPAWSLDCEVVYYAMIPLTVVAVRRLAPRPATDRLRVEVWALAGLAILSLLYKAWFYSWGDPGNSSQGVFLFQPGWNLDLFVLGMAAAVWSAQRQVTQTSDRVVRLLERHGGIAWLAAAGLFVVLSLNSDKAFSDSGSLSLHALRGAMALCLLLPAIWGRPGEGLVRRVLGTRGLLTVGVVSYSFYLFHKMWLDELFALRPGGFTGPAADAALVGAAFICALTTSALMWLVVERPVLSLKRLVPDPIARREGAERPPVPVTAER